MAQDIISDALNQIMNANRADKKQVVIRRSSKFLLQVLKHIKENGNIDFKLEEDLLIVEIKKINECRTIKPRFNAGVLEIDKYARRFLPSRNLGVMLISTSKGLMNHWVAQEKKLGGSLIAYFY
jgi:ribosomal protein S8